MSIICESFPSVEHPGKYDDKSRKYTIYGEGDLSAQIITYGARIFRLNVPDRVTGDISDVVLGPKDLDGYLKDPGNHGAIVGRSANRIEGASFAIDGTSYSVPRNDGNNNLHTGDKAFQFKFWDAKVLSHEDSVAYVKASGIKGLCDDDLKLPFDESLLLSCDSEDGENGFPGNLKTEVLYTFTNDGTFLILYKGLSDKKTIFAPTNHAYFNIEGHDNGTVKDQILTVLCDKVTYKDENNCPDGRYLDVDGTIFDFRNGAPVSKCLDLNDPQTKNCRGVDQNFCLNNNGRYELVARLEAPASSKGMEVWTDLPGIQLYAANHLESEDNKDGAVYRPYDALCLEAQLYPNAVNVPEFISPVIEPGQPKYYACGYRFYK